MRPKKKKVPVVENVANDEVPWETGSTVQEEASASTLVDDGDDIVLEEAKAQEKELKVWTKGSVDKARKLVAECKVHVRKAEAALRHEERLAEERERRWWAAERHAAPPPAYLQLERVYKTIVKGLKAKLELSEARRVVAQAEVRLEKCLTLQLEVKHAGELKNGGT